MNKEKIVEVTKELIDSEGVPNICVLAVTGEGDREQHSFACNLADSILTLYNLSTGLCEEKYEKQYEIYRIFLPQVYLICEEISAVLKTIGLSYEIIDETFPFIKRIRRLMNFLKHPKMRGFFKDPQYIFIDKSQFVPGYNLNNRGQEIISFFADRGDVDKVEILQNSVYFFTKDNQRLTYYPNQSLPDEYVKYNDKKKDATFVRVKPADISETDLIEFKKIQYGHLKNGAKRVPVFFSENEIRKFYSNENNEDRKKVEAFCDYERLPIILPTISSLIIELKELTNRLVEILEGNPFLLKNIEKYAYDASDFKL